MSQQYGETLQHIRMLRNPVYAGMAPHKGKSFQGEHDAIVDQATWDRVLEAMTPRELPGGMGSAAQLRPVSKNL